MEGKGERNEGRGGQARPLGLGKYPGCEHPFIRVGVLFRLDGTGHREILTQSCMLCYELAWVGSRRTRQVDPMRLGLMQPSRNQWMWSLDALSAILLPCPSVLPSYSGVGGRVKQI
jgi:hypothetical protein